MKTYVNPSHMKLVIGSDHAGFALKKRIIEFLYKKGIVLKDKGTFSDESVDYPDFAHPLANAIEKGEAEFGVLICGSGNGVSMTANKYPGVRAALCWSEEVAILARQHNNANIISLPARFISEDHAERIVEAFLSAKFEGGRHEARVRKIKRR